MKTPFEEMVKQELPWVRETQKYPYEAVDELFSAQPGQRLTAEHIAARKKVDRDMRKERSQFPDIHVESRGGKYPEMYPPGSRRAKLPSGIEVKVSLVVNGSRETKAEGLDLYVKALARIGAYVQWLAERMEGEYREGAEEELRELAEEEIRKRAEEELREPKSEEERFREVEEMLKELEGYLEEERIQKTERTAKSERTQGKAGPQRSGAPRRAPQQSGSVDPGL
jgi:hypothetical protein